MNKYLVFACFNLLLVLPSQAQIVPTSSSGSTVGSERNVRGVPSTIIDGGKVKGANLFHSFERFDIPQDRGAYFSNPNGINNIFSVVKNRASNIDGVLGILGNANLYFINPNGIFFGRDSALDLKSSLFLSTASKLNFSDGSFWQVKDESPILSASNLSGVEFSGNEGQIRIEGQGHSYLIPTNGFEPIARPPLPVNFTLEAGNTFSAIANGIYLDGGVVNVPSGNIYLTSINKGNVSVKGETDSLSLADLTFDNRSLLENSGLAPGDIHLKGKNMYFPQGVIFSSNFGVSRGTIALDAFNGINFGLLNPGLTPYYTAGIRSDNFAASGTSIFLKAKDINLLASNNFSIANYGFGLAPDLTINSSTLNMEGSLKYPYEIGSTILASSFNGTQVPNIRLIVSDIKIKDGGLISSINFSNSSQGGIFVKSNSILVSGYTQNGATNSSITSLSLFGGKLPSIKVETNELKFLNGGLISASNFKQGGEGSIDISAKDIVIQGTSPVYASGINSRTTGDAPIIKAFFGIQIPTGDSANITINARTLNVSDGGSISLANTGTGKGGILTLNVPKISLESGGSITAATASGNGGEIAIASNNLQLQNASITATAGNRGRGGNIKIATDTLVLDRSFVSADAFLGEGGNVRLDSSIVLRRNSNISASSQLGVSGLVQLNESSASQLAAFSSPPATINTQPTLTTACSLNSPKFYIRGRDILPALPGDLEFLPDEKAKVELEANTLVTDDDGRIALKYIPPQQLGYPDPCAKAQND